MAGRSLCDQGAAQVSERAQPNRLWKDSSGGDIPQAGLSTTANVTDGNKVATEQFVLDHAGGGAVDSVNGQTGVVVLTNSDVGLGNVTNDAQLKASSLDTDGTLSANSDSKVASQKATKTYADTMLPKAGGTTTGAIVGPAGSASADAFAVRAANNGLYSSAANTANIAANGTEAMRFQSSQVSSRVPLSVTQQFLRTHKIVDFDALGTDYTVTSGDGSVIVLNSTTSLPGGLYLPATGGVQYTIYNAFGSADIINISTIGQTISPGGKITCEYDAANGGWTATMEALV